MKSFQLHAKQGLPISKAEAWDFLSDPENLAAITPDSMSFEILAGASMPMFKGQIIHYKVSPFPGLKTRWVTEITHLNPMEYFVDEQRFGPYALWHHKHFLKAIENGVLMEDLIDYKMPLGLVGQALHGILVQKQLQKVFQFRYEKLKRLFGEIPNIKPVLKFTSI